MSDAPGGRACDSFPDIVNGRVRVVSSPLPSSLLPNWGGGEGGCEGGREGGDEGGSGGGLG